MSDTTDSKQRWQTIQNALSELPSEISPQKDLWPEIAQRIDQKERKHPQFQRWMPVAVAASLLVAVASMFFSWHTWSQYSAFVEQQQAQLDRQTLFNVLEQQHRLSKTSFLQKLEQQPTEIDPAVVADLINNVMVIEQALQDIKSALILEPANERLIALLKKTYEKQDALISQTRLNYRTI